MTLLPNSVETWEPPADTTPVPMAVRGLRSWYARHLQRGADARDRLQSLRTDPRGLPVAPLSVVGRYLGGLFRSRPRLVAAMLVLNAAAALVGLVVPKVLGDLVDRLAAGTLSSPTQQLLLVLGAVIVQTLLTFGAGASTGVLGQNVLARAREDVVRRVLDLPLGRLEQASTGDLISRVTRDVRSMSRSVQFALPRMIIALVTVVLTLVAMVWNSWLLALPLLLTLGITAAAMLPYLRHATAGYTSESARAADQSATFAESIEGAATTEALRLGPVRRIRAEGDIDRLGDGELYTIGLRNLLFGWLDLAYRLPTLGTIIVGGWAYASGSASIGQITTALLYAQALIAPLDQLIMQFDTLQMGAAATTRLLGIGEVPADRRPGPDRPAGERLVGRELRFAYREDHDVLHGIDLELRPGERLAIVGPSGSGKSTLSRLLSGINGPRTGSVTVGGVELLALPLPVLRTEVALVTQEHHIFVGTLRDNILLAREDACDDQLWQALTTVAAADWVRGLARGLDTLLGAGHTSLTPAQAQQVALARLVLADPHTLVLDEATSLIDPRTARDLEGSLSAVLAERTVVAVAHRLHTAHDADRIAVVVDGRIAELGSHDELVARDGEYAALWRAWTS